MRVNKKQVITKEDLQTYYKTCRKIKFKGDYKPDSILDILNKIKNHNNSEATYFKKGSLHCTIERRRSIDDYVNLCHYYFPEITVKECLDSVTNIDNLKVTHEYIDNYTAQIGYCGNIRKSNFWVTCYSNHKPVDKLLISNLGFTNCNLTYEL